MYQNILTQNLSSNLKHKRSLYKTIFATIICTIKILFFKVNSLEEVWFRILSMKISFFSCKPYDKTFFEDAIASVEEDSPQPLDFHFLKERLGEDSYKKALGSEALCLFVNDHLSTSVLEELCAHGLRLILMRCAGFNNVPVERARALGVPVLRVPSYSPTSVAEHAAAMALTLTRKTHLAYNRTRSLNFALDGLLGVGLHGRTAGVVGTGKIGAAFARICLGFGMRVLAFDKFPDKSLVGVVYVELETLFKEADLISLHVPLFPETEYLVNRESIAQMKPGVVLINTSRGRLVQSDDLIAGIKSGQIGAAGLDVYEHEERFFFEDGSNEPCLDDQLARLLVFNNVLVTGHQAFFTKEAMKSIARTTLDNVLRFVRNEELVNAV